MLEATIDSPEGMTSGCPEAGSEYSTSSGVRRTWLELAGDVSLDVISMTTGDGR